MTFLEGLLWAAILWAIFLAFVIVDVPTYFWRAAGLLREQHLPHWARHGHAPPAADTIPHGRHAKTTRGGSV